MEFGVSGVLPNYSGGLGVLAGDHLKAASDLGVPLVAVGLLYRSGYFRQSLALDGWQVETYPVLDPQGLPLYLLTGNSGEPLLVTVSMPGGRVLSARVWRAAVGRVPLLLLDSDIEENDPDLRSVTDRLYGGDQNHRIRQEILVGIGGVRAVRAFCAASGHPAPTVFHTNEGHAGYLGLERIRELQDAEGLDFDEALAVVRAGTVFTTHTPVPAGIDRRVGDDTDASGSDAGVVSNRADRHRRGRPTPAAPVVDEFDAFDEDELLYVLVDYHRSPLGAWTAILVSDGFEPVALQATTAHDAFHKATELIEVLSEHADVAISTMHTLDGDPVAWATLAAREGFVDCAISDNTLAALITHN